MVLSSMLTVAQWRLGVNLSINHFRLWNLGKDFRIQKNSGPCFLAFDNHEFFTVIIVV